jgi:hypothetical protein
MWCVIFLCGIHPFGVLVVLFAYDVWVCFFDYVRYGVHGCRHGGRIVGILGFRMILAYLCIRDGINRPLLAGLDMVGVWDQVVLR